jgi:TRAP-type C4-dicarboxylate transport system substrate-binding protein
LGTPGSPIVTGKRDDAIFKQLNMGLVSWGSAFLVLVVDVFTAQAATVTMNYSLPWPATHGNTILAADWAKEVEKRTNGAVKINIFPGGTLTPLDQTYDGVVKGICDIEGCRS